MDLRLSIIIPVYNTENWIGRCLDSCLEQDVPNSDYEIIVVNDGSTDNSMAVVKSYMQKYNNIRLVSQDNGGASKARNRGIKEARGEYIWFIDSDDYVENNCINELLAISYKRSLDVLCFGLKLFFENGSSEVFPISNGIGDGVCKGDDFILKVGMPPAVWCAIYRRKYIIDANLRFIEGITFEDLDFSSRVYYQASALSFYDKPFYYYFQREGSVMKSANPKKAKDLLVVADSLYSFTLSTVGQGRDAYKVMMNKVSFAFAQSLRNCVDVKDDVIKEYESKPYYPLAINCGLTVKEKIKYRLINVSVRLYLFVYKLLKI